MSRRVLKPYMKTFSGDTETPITLFYKYVGDEVGFLLESRTTDSKGRYSFMGKNPQAILSGKEKLVIEQKDRTNEYNGKLLEGVRDYLDQFKIIEDEGVPFTGGAVGTIAYDTIRQYEKLPEINPDVLGMPDVHMMVFTEVIAYDHLHGQISVIVLEEADEQGKSTAQTKIAQIEAQILRPVDKNIYEFDMEQKSKITFTSNRTKEEYMDMVKKAKKYIYDGDIFQVVLSQRLTASVEENPLQLYRRLRAINPSPYLYYLNFGAYQVAGSSPEMIVELRGDKVYTCPIAGSRKRGKDAAEDVRLANELLNDPKEKAEHVMLVDLARNDMGRISQIGTVQVTNFMKVQNYSHIMHLVSLVEGKKREDATPFEILSTFLPAGTLSGAPKIRAMEIIEELEPQRRGLYGGAVGYFGFNGNMDFCIAIRTMIIKDGKAYMQAGAGIVADSDPETEYEESHSKVRALVKTIGGEI